MMKYTKYTILIVVISMISLTNVSAQSEDFSYERAYEDYIYVRNLYRNEHEEYLNARAAYIASQTFSLREQAEQETREMLIARDDLARVYLTALRVRVGELPGIDGGKKSQIYTNLDSEVFWYQNHKDVYQETDTLEALIQKSDEVQKRYDTTTLPLVYDTLFNISLGKVTGIRRTEENLYQDVGNEIERIRANGDKNTAVIERWLSDIEGQLSTVRSQEEAAVSEYNENNKRSTAKVAQDAYEDGTEVLYDAYLSLGNVIGYLEEIIREVMRADG